MKFKTAIGTVFEIPDDWWIFAEMNNFSPGESTAYVYRGSPEIFEVPITEIEAPTRDPDVAFFQKCRMLPILFAFGCYVALPPIVIRPLKNSSGLCRFTVYNGYHRYYASIAAGFAVLPVILAPKIVD